VIYCLRVRVVQAEIAKCHVIYRLRVHHIVQAEIVKCHVIYRLRVHVVRGAGVQALKCQHLKLTGCSQLVTRGTCCYRQPRHRNEQKRHAASSNL